VLQKNYLKIIGFIFGYHNLFFFFCCFFILFFEIGFHYVTQADLKLTVYIPGGPQTHDAFASVSQVLGL
jgi:hypothetical protein